MVCELPLGKCAGSAAPVLGRWNGAAEAPTNENANPALPVCAEVACVAAGAGSMPHRSILLEMTPKRSDPRLAENIGHGIDPAGHNRDAIQDALCRLRSAEHL